MKFVALGGNNELGKNFYVLDIDNRLIILDCGIKTPSKSEFGVDYVIADTKYLENNKNRIAAFIISHGHDDNCGGLPFILDNFIDVKIYLNNITHFAIENLINCSRRWKLKKINFNYIFIESNKSYNITNDIILNTFEVTHSYPGTLNFIISSKNENILYLTDYVITGKNIWDRPIPNLINAIENKNIDLLLSDCSNISNPGFTSPNFSIGIYLNNIFYHYHNKERFIIACYESNIYYIYEIIKFFAAKNIPVYINNDYIYRFIKMIARKDYINLNNVKFLYMSNNIVPKQGAIIIVENTEKLFSELYNIALGNDTSLKLSQEGDLFISLAGVISGNELNVVKSLNEIVKNGVTVAESPIKNIVGMHPSSEDLRLVLSVVKPKYFIPIKGLYRELKTAYEIGLDYLSPNNIALVDNGKIVEIDRIKKEFKFLPHRLPIKDVYIDGTGIGDVSHLVINERKILGNNGTIIIAFNVIQNVVSSNVTIEIIGVLNDDEVIIVKKELSGIIDKCIAEADFKDLSFLKIKIKKNIEKFMWKKVRKEPIILPIIIEK